jgi:hypothetical protein
MNALEKLEQFLNQILIRLIDVLVRFTPTKIKNLWLKIEALSGVAWAKMKAFPKNCFEFLLKLVGSCLQTLKILNPIVALKDAYQKSLAKYQQQTQLGFKVLRILATPFYIISAWIQGLSTTQAMLLLSFIGGSILSIISIGFSGQKLLRHHLDSGRTPASIEEIVYDRPDYYKKQTRHLELTNFRLPVYIADINELKTVDVDFIVTLSNRKTMQYLSKYEFELRDHFILEIEPSVASFPLEDEGKEIIRKKVWDEINVFLKNKNINGEVVELKVTYILAN